MRKRIIAIIGAVLMTALLVGCGSTDESPFFYEGSSGRFKTIESQPYYKVYVDTQTGVEYLMTSKGNVTVLVDKDGKPLLANGWRDYD